ncbi:MAG: hypothetical protein R2705_21370 [Ilumatobacteraceae bacterium]
MKEAVLDHHRPASSSGLQRLFWIDGSAIVACAYRSHLAYVDPSVTAKITSIGNG